MRTACCICNRYYTSKHRGWYEYYVPRVCSAPCFLRLCREGYPELRIETKRETRIAKFRHSDRSLRSDYERWLWEFIRSSKVPCDYEPFIFTLLDGTRYVPDFYIANRVFVEVKGLWLGDGKKKLLAFREEFPDHPIYIADKQFLDMLRRSK